MREPLLSTAGNIRSREGTKDDVILFPSGKERRCASPVQQAPMLSS